MKEHLARSTSSVSRDRGGLRQSDWVYNSIYLENQALEPAQKWGDSTLCTMLAIAPIALNRYSPLATI
jgi:hypothetical protein